MTKRKTAAERRAAADAARSERLRQTFERLEALKLQMDEMGRMLDALKPPSEPH